VSDVKYGGLEFNPGPAIYVLWKELPAGQLYLAVKSAADAESLIPALRATLQQVDAHMPLMPIRGMEEVFHRSEREREFRALVGASIALLSLVIALVGIAGTLGRLVSERRQELAIRIALGATAGGIMRHILVAGAMICALGVVAGAIGTVLVRSVLRTFVVGVSPGDPLALAAVALLVFAGGAAASYLPARRAAAANPLEMFRRV
jgi:ABC-type antimicrobial peptide transport system permease subunit